MTNEEREAYANSYGNNVAYLNKDKVMEFLARYFTEDDNKLYEEYGADWTSIVDGLGIWNDAKEYIKEEMNAKLNP
jgi:hypothetical protein